MLIIFHEFHYQRKRIRQATLTVRLGDSELIYVPMKITLVT